MGRRDLSEERRPQIIAAAKRAITKYGIDGATQERIAEEAGMSRPHIRHYLGNRDELLDAVWNATIGGYLEAVEEATSVTGPPEQVAEALQRLLTSSFVYEEDDAVILAFLHESREDEQVRVRTRDTYARVEASIARLVRNAAPGSSEAEIAERAHALTAMSMGALMLDLLDPQAPRADRLVGVAASLALMPRHPSSDA